MRSKESAKSRWEKEAWEGENFVIQGGGLENPFEDLHEAHRSYSGHGILSFRLVRDL